MRQQPEIEVYVAINTDGVWIIDSDKKVFLMLQSLILENLFLSHSLKRLIVLISACLSWFKVQ